MTLSVRFSTRPLAELERKLKELPKRVVRVTMSAGSKALVKRVRDGFWSSRGPTGRKWARLKRRRGRPLWVTRALMKSFQPVMAGRGFGIRTRDKKFKFHQDGTKTKDGEVHIPARPMLPDPGTMPKSWERDITKAVNKAVDAEMRKVFG